MAADDTALRVCLSRTVDLNATTLRFYEWPGYGRPIVHFALDSDLAPALAEAFAPVYRVLSLPARPDQPYQTDASDVRELLGAFGFDRPLLVGDGHGALAPLLVAAWWPALVGALLLVAPVHDASATGITGRGVRECAPDWDALMALVRCPFQVLDRFSAPDVEDLLRAAS